MTDVTEEMRDKLGEYIRELPKELLPSVLNQIINLEARYTPLSGAVMRVLANDEAAYHRSRLRQLEGHDITYRLGNTPTEEKAFFAALSQDDFYVQKLLGRLSGTKLAEFENALALCRGVLEDIYEERGVVANGD